jgi:maleate isomerase
MADLEYAKRGLVGVLTPQANTTVEPEFTILWPAGISMINARMTSPKGTIVDRLYDYIEKIDSTLDSFANAPLDAAAFGCTGASYLISPETEAEMCERIERARGYPFVTAARAVCDSLEALGAKRIGLASPYPPDLTETSVGYWEKAGFIVGEIASAFNPDSEFHPIYSLQAGSAAESLKLLENKDLDAIVMLGTGMPTLRPILDKKDWSGPPVTSCMLSLAWRTVLHMDGETPSAASVLAWSRGEDWSDRMKHHHLS